MKTLLTLKDITVAYNGVVTVDKASLSVQEGDYACLIGANGSGKSTLIKSILGLIPVRGGKMEWGIPKQQVSYLPQIDYSDHSFPATVKEIVLCGTQKKGRRLPFYTKEDRRAAEEAMELLGVTEFQQKRIGDLSGGQRQRAMLARALCRRPKLLILDEPCTGLDPQITAELYTLLERFNREQGLSILMASHDLGEVGRCASRVIVVDRGVSFDGTAEEWRLSGVFTGNAAGIQRIL